MKHLIKVCENHATIFLNDRIFVSDALLLRCALLEVINQGVTDLRIDLSGLSYTYSSSALETLVSINKHTKDKNARLVLMGAQRLLSDRIKRTRLDKIFTIV